MLAQAAECLQEIGKATDSVFLSLNLRPFLLRLPLPPEDASSTIQGICEKVVKNRSFSHTRSNPLDDSTEQPDISRSEAQVQCIRELLSNGNAAGFVLVVVENPSVHTSDLSEVQYCPVAGGVVEVLDSSERSVRAIWCRRSLPLNVSEIIIRALSLRLFAYGFASSQQVVPNLLDKDLLLPSKTPVSSRLISCTQESMFLFPRNATAFMKSELCMSKHWETPLDGGTHIDHPKAPCRCSSKRNVPGAWQFSGISLSRFVNYWRNHGRTAISEIPTYAVSYFIAPTRSQQERASVNGTKRLRRLDHDSFKTERESRSPERADGEVAGRVASHKASEASDVISSESPELRRGRALAGVKSGVEAEKRRAGAARLERSTETRRRRCIEVAGLTLPRS